MIPYHIYRGYKPKLKCWLAQLQIDWSPVQRQVGATVVDIYSLVRFEVKWWMNSWWRGISPTMWCFAPSAMLRVQILYGCDKVCDWLRSIIKKNEFSLISYMVMYLHCQLSSWKFLYIVSLISFLGKHRGCLEVRGLRWN